ncbi:MAG: radical SAM protein [Nanoarchaeota archaeon]
MTVTTISQPETSEEVSEKRFVEFLNRGENPYDYERMLLKRHFPRIQAILQGKSPPPYELEIQPSAKCDINCKHCFGRDCPKLQGKIEKKEIDKLAEDMQDFEQDDFKIETVKFCGTTGEPLVNKYTAYAIEVFSEIGTKIRMFTNGMGITRTNHLGISNLESILKINHLNLSLDAGKDETIKRIKGNNADYNQIMNGLERISVLRKNKKPALVVSYVITQDNYFDVERATHDAKNAGADVIRFKIDLTAQSEITSLSEQIIEILQRAKEHESEDFKVISIHSDEEIQGKNPGIFGERTGESRCYTSYLWGCVGPDFQLYPCGHSCHGASEPYGNLHEQTLKEIWKSRKAKERRENLPCEGCNFCPPFGSRTNDFMTFLSASPLEKIKELHEEYIENRK